MTDPNVTYKLAFADLTLKLGRVPNAAECLPLHESYKRAFEGMAAAGRPEPEGFSRKPAPQARAIDTQVRAREATYKREGTAEGAWGPLSGPTINAEPTGVRSAPEPPANKPGASEPPLVVASAPCRACGREFERPARKGRPPVRCEECR